MRQKFDRVAFIGEMGAGKDTVAEFFKTPEHSHVAFGTGIRNVVKVLRETVPSNPTRNIYEAMMYIYKEIVYGRSRCLPYTEACKVLEVARKIPKTKKDREITQFIGTELRGLLPSIWLEYGLKDLTEKCVLTDCRRENEFEALRDHGFTMVYVESPSEMRLHRLRLRDGVGVEQFYKDQSHVAEREIRGLKKRCDIVIENLGDPEALRRKVYALTRNY